MTRWYLWILAASLSTAFSAQAQDSAAYTFKTGRELLRAPTKYVGKPVSIVDGFCLYDEPSIVCIGNETPFEVKARSVRDASTLARLKDKCGGDIPGKEHNPTPDCAYSFKFVPTSVKIGTGDYILHDVVQSGKRLVLFETDVLAPTQR